MTKTILIFLTLCLATFSVSIAQPTLTATGINPILGEKFTLMTAPYITAGNSGANQTWNLAFTGGTSGGTINVVSPSSTPKGSSFPNANLALANPTAASVLYQKSTSLALQNYGFVGGSAGTVSPYSNPEDILRFPFLYNNTYSDKWTGQFVSAGETYFRSGTTTVTADGYGTLTTPNATYTNVMRVHFVQDYQDSVDLGGFPFLISYLNDQYMWYKDGIHIQVATVFELTSDVSAPFTGGNYLTGNGSDIIQISDCIKSANIFPNPAKDQLSLAINLTENKKINILVFNAIGQQLNIQLSADGIQGNNNIQLDVTELPEGIYFAHIIIEGKIAETKRFVIGN